MSPWKAAISRDCWLVTSVKSKQRRAARCRQWIEKPCTFMQALVTRSTALVQVQVVEHCTARDPENWSRIQLRMPPT